MKIEEALNHAESGDHTTDDPIVVLANEVRALLATVARLEGENKEVLLQLGGIQSAIAEELNLPRTPITDPDVRSALRLAKEGRRRTRSGWMRYKHTRQA